MDITLPEIIKENNITFAIGLAITLTGAMIKIVIGLIDFYEETFKKRYFKRLHSLTEHTTKDSTLSKYINALKDNETFQLASGINVSPAKADLLMNIYLLGITNSSDLKRLAPYLDAKNKQALIKVNWLDKVQFTYSFLSAIFFFSSGIIISAAHFINSKGLENYISLIILFIFIIPAFIIGRDYVTFLILKKIREKLIDSNMLFNPEHKIRWAFIDWIQQKISLRKNALTNHSTTDAVTARDF